MQYPSQNRVFKITAIIHLTHESTIWAELSRETHFCSTLYQLGWLNYGAGGSIQAHYMDKTNVKGLALCRYPVNTIFPFSLSMNFCLVVSSHYLLLYQKVIESFPYVASISSIEKNSVWQQCFPRYLHRNQTLHMRQCAWNRLEFGFRLKSTKRLLF